MAAPISRATIFAKVVLPKPGGPKNEGMIKRFTPPKGSANKNIHLLFDCRLTDILGQFKRAQSMIMTRLARRG